MSEAITEEALKELVEMEKLATPAPWELREAEGLSGIAHSAGWVFESDSTTDLLDNRFTAAARNAIPGMLALIEQQRAEIAERKNLQRDTVLTDADRWKAVLAATGAGSKDEAVALIQKNYERTL